MIEYSARNLPQSCIKFNHPVKNVRLLVKKLHNTGPDEELLLVECENGAFFRTRHVVVTCSVNYLQKHYSTLFDSRLMTEKKIESINTVQMSTVDKIFLFYDDLASFFPRETVAVKPVFMQEKQFADNMRENWINKVYTFDKFYDNVLLVWLTGEEANYVENLSEEEISTKLTDLLRKLLKNQNVPKINLIDVKILLNI